MEKDTCRQVLEKIEKQMNQMKVQADAASLHLTDKEMDGFYAHAIKLEDAAERTVLLTRVLPAYTGNPRAGLDTETIMEDCIPVEIGFTEEGWFSLRIPALLPKKETGSKDYIRSFLYPALRKFFSGKQPVRYMDSVMIYRHIYSSNRPDRRKRDHDNIEVNMVSDTVALYVMPDDGPGVCSHYYCSNVGNEDRTEVYVLPKNDFILWLQKEPLMSNEGVKLYETKLP